MLRDRMRLRVFSRGAAWRLATLSVALGVGGTWAYFAMLRMPGASYSGALAPLDPRGEVTRDRLRSAVEVLAGDIGERSVRRPEGLRRAADWIERGLTSDGFAPKRQTFSVDGVACDNVEAEIAGSDLPSEIVIIGAHYDSVAFTVGANDNASGVAAMLELARRSTSWKPRRTLRFVAFANEEPPYFQTPQMGSAVYAKRSRDRGEHIVAMLSLETIGFYSETPGSQQYPPPLSLAYPSTGNFIGLVADRSSSELVRGAIASFRRSTPFPSEGAALPASFPGVGWSDQWSFWQNGYPGIMVTDTAPFRYPHYHSASDTPDKLDYDRMARVVDGVERVVAGWVGVP
jgi:hypothetical protein